MSKRQGPPVRPRGGSRQLWHRQPSIPARSSPVASSGAGDAPHSACAPGCRHRERTGTPRRCRSLKPGDRLDRQRGCAFDACVEPMLCQECASIRAAASSTGLWPAMHRIGASPVKRGSRSSGAEPEDRRFQALPRWRRRPPLLPDQPSDRMSAPDPGDRTGRPPTPRPCPSCVPGAPRQGRREAHRRGQAAIPPERPHRSRRRASAP